jgi:hypothetical protein
VREFYPSATCYGVTAIYRGLDTTLRYAAAAELTQEHETGCHRRSELVAVLHVVRHDRSRHGLSADRASLFIYPGPIHHGGYREFTFHVNCLAATPIQCNMDVVGNPARPLCAKSCGACPAQAKSRKQPHAK